MIRALRQLAQLAARHTADDEAVRPRRAVGRVAVLPRFLRAEEVGPVRPAALIDGLVGVWVVFVLRGADAAGGCRVQVIPRWNLSWKAFRFRTTFGASPSVEVFVGAICFTILRC